VLSETVPNIHKIDLYTNIDDLLLDMDQPLSYQSIYTCRVSLVITIQGLMNIHVVLTMAYPSYYV
jgi:hypothetical protein